MTTLVKPTCAFLWPVVCRIAETLPLSTSIIGWFSSPGARGFDLVENGVWLAMPPDNPVAAVLDDEVFHDHDSTL